MSLTSPLDSNSIPTMKRKIPADALLATPINGEDTEEDPPVNGETPFDPTDPDADPPPDKRVFCEWSVRHMPTDLLARLKMVAAIRNERLWKVHIAALEAGLPSVEGGVGAHFQAHLR